MEFDPIGYKYKKKHPPKLTDEDRATIEREVLNKTPRRQIFDMLENKSFKAVESYIAVVRKKHGIKGHFNYRNEG